MRKVLLATDKPFVRVAVDGIRKIVTDAGYEFALLEKYPGKAELVAAVADADALIVRSDKVDCEVLDAAKKLKIVVRAGAGYDNIDLAAANEKKVVVMNTPGQNSNAVAELAIGMLIFMARNQFNGTSGSELRGKKLGLHAFGAVSKRVAEIAKGIGMEVFAYDPFLKPTDIEKAGVKALASVAELFSTCNIVSLHIPATAETKGSINIDLLSKMPAPATLINTAREEVVHEPCLLSMFEQRKDFVYIADVAPACKDEIAQKFPGRFFFTPKKMGAQTEEANINSGLAAANEIRDFFEKGITACQVNKF